MKSSAVCLVLLVVWWLPLLCHAEEKVYQQDGDLIIGGIIPLHFFNHATRQCEGLRDLSALRRVEAVRYAISVINEDNNLLGNITLGYEIYDSCSSPVETLWHSLKFIPEMRRAKNMPDNIIGVVGPQRSANSVQATNLLGLYNITAVSYLSTSDELSDSDKFPYFLRTVPPDKFQVSVIADMLKEYQWKYVAFVYSDDTYGKNAEAEFRDQAGKNGICIGYSRSISGSEDAHVYDDVIEDLLELRRESLVSVVILFTLLETATNVFGHAAKADIDRDFIWIGSDGWGNYDLTPVRGAEDSALGAFTIVPKAEIHPGFNEFFVKTVRCNGSTENPWLTEYCEAYNYSHDAIQKTIRPPYESLVVDSVYVIARGLRDMQAIMCNENQTKAECLENLVDNRRLLRDFLLNVNFTSDSNGLVSFTRNGDSTGRYDIRYFVKNDSDYHFTTAGNWLEYTQPKLTLERVDWYLKHEPNRKSFTDENMPKSVCSDPCETLQVMKKALQDCCWTCDVCKDNEIIRENECLSCFYEANLTYMWPNPSLTHCVPLDNLQLLHEVENVILLLVALLGITVEGVVAYLYIKNRNERLIRASSRELGYIILVGIFLAYISAILYCIPAHIVSCFLRRIVPSVATTFIYVSLLTMTVRLYRIFTAGQRTTKRPQFISPMSQVTLTLIISIIPLIWALVWIFVHPPDAAVIPPTKERQIIEKMCVVSKEYRIGQLTWEVVIVMVNCYFAIRTRNLPANYNQTRFIAFSVFSTLVVFIAFAPAFFITDRSSQQDLYSALGYIIQPTVILILIFIAKIYAVYFVTEENQQVISTRPSIRKSSEIVTPPSPLRTVSAGALTVSFPPTPGPSSDKIVSDVSAQTEPEVDTGPRIYKTPSRQLNTDESSNDSIEIHSLEEGEMQKESST